MNLLFTNVSEEEEEQKKTVGMFNWDMYSFDTPLVFYFYYSFYCYYYYMIIWDKTTSGDNYLVMWMLK